MTRGAKHLRHRARLVFQLIERFACDHVGFSRVGIQRQDLMVDIEDIFHLTGPQITVFERQQQLQVFGVGGGGFLQVGGGMRVVTQAVVRHAGQDLQRATDRENWARRSCKGFRIEWPPL